MNRMLPKPLLVIATANIAAALICLGVLPSQGGARAAGTLALAMLYGVIAGGLLWRRNWARGLMLAWALFQIGALATGSAVEVLMLQMKPFSAWTALLWIISLVLIPFLWWASVWLLRERTRSLFVPAGAQE